MILKVDITEAVEGSFYRGKVHVGIKEHAFKPSFAMRHATELDGVFEDDFKPIIALYTDGGPDHQTNLLSVQASLTCLFLKEERDMICCG